MILLQVTKILICTFEFCYDVHVRQPVTNFWSAYC